MSDFAVQMQSQSRTIIASSDMLTGFGMHFIAWGGAGASAVWPLANRAFFVPFLIHQPYTVLSMFAQNGSTVSGSAHTDVGIYNEGGALLVSSGSTTQGTTNTAQSFNITDTLLLPGVYYMACSFDSVSGTFWALTHAAPLMRAAGILSQSSAFPLPNPATFAAVSDAYCPIFGVLGKATL